MSTVDSIKARVALLGTTIPLDENPTAEACAEQVYENLYAEADLRS